MLGKNIVMKLRLLLLVFLVSGFAFAQTTVTLQDQCNCEVLSGTAVVAAGAINPSGADTGDIYVNTNTGTIYFWDGNSWELTSTDDQQLQNFNFNGATNTLTLDIEDGNTVSVDLSALSNSGTDDQVLSLAGNILTLEDGGTVNLTPYLDNTDDQLITAFSLDASNILTITLESGNTRTVDLSALVGTDDQTAAEVNYDNTTSLITATNVQDAIDEINAASGTVALVDNGDGTYDFTDAAGTTTTITDTSISTLADNADGTYTYTDETGATQTIDTNAGTNPYDNTTSGLAALNVQDAIDEINAASGTVALLDNGDGTYDFTDAAGTTTTITDTSISTLVDNGDATFTYTDESGTPVTITLISADANNDITAGTDGGLYLNVASVTIAETITNLVDNTDGTLTYTNESGAAQTVAKADLTDNLDGTYTFTNNDGSDVTIDTNGMVISNVIAGNLIATVTDASGAAADIDESITTLADNLDGSFTYTSEDGTITTFTETLTGLVDNTDGTFTYTDEDGTATTFDAKIATVLDNLDGTYTITDDFGTSVTIDTNNVITTLADNGDGSFTYTSEDGTVTTFTETDDQNLTGATLTGTSLEITIENGTAASVDLTSLNESVVGINDISVTEFNGVYTVDYVDGDKDASNEIQTLTSTDGSVTLTPSGSDYDLSVAVADGSETVVNGGGINVVTGSGTSVDPYVVTGTEVDGSVTNEINTAFAVNGTNLDITDSNGTLSVALADLGSDDQNASEVPYTPYLTITSTDVQAAINELKDEVDANLDGFIVGNSTFIDLQNVGSATIPDITAVLSATGTTDATTFLRGDNTWAVPPTGTDDQTAAEVNLATAVDTNGDATNETTVEEAIQAIAPITSKAARVFYPPSIAVDASTNGTFNVDLYAQYIAQFGTPTVASAGAPAAVPTYTAADLYYYVTYADPTVFNTGTMSINASGVLSYEIIGQPADYNSLINVVFVVK